jgi:predicted PilT family ATPase
MTDLLVVLVPSAMIPIIIGKKGAGVRSIEEKSGTVLSVPRSQMSGAEQILLIKKGDTKRRAHALRLIHDTLVDVQEETMRANGSTHGYEGAKVLVASDRVPLLVGKRGATIKEIEQESGARLAIPARSHSGPEVDGIEQTCVTLTGASSSIQRGAEIVQEKLAAMDSHPNDHQRDKLRDN